MKGVTVKLPDTTLRRLRQEARATGRSVAALIRERLSNGAPVTELPGASPSSWIVLRRRWRKGDLLQVTLPMELAVEPTPDHPAVQALTYGPVVLSGVYPKDPGSLTPPLTMASIHRTATQPMTFAAISGGKPIKLIPIARAAHEYYTTYFQMV